MTTTKEYTLQEVRTWARENSATRCIGTIMLPSGTGRLAAMAVTDDTVLAVVPYWGAAAVYRQVWDGSGVWTITHEGDIDGDLGDVEAVYEALFTCPRCGGEGVVEDVERQGPFLMPALNPCPLCQGEVADSQPPLPF